MNWRKILLAGSDMDVSLPFRRATFQVKAGSGNRCPSEKSLVEQYRICLPALPFHSGTNPTHAPIPNQPDFTWKSLRQVDGRASQMDR
jgi:hypothetical protein